MGILGKIPKIGKKSRFGIPGVPGEGGFTSTPRGARRRDPGVPGDPPDPVRGLPGASPGGGAWTPVPGIRDLGTLWGPWVPGTPGRPLRGSPSPSREGARGLFYINPSRRGPAVPQGVPPWNRGRGRSPLGPPDGVSGPGLPGG